MDGMRQKLVPGMSAQQLLHCLLRLRQPVRGYVDQRQALPRVEGRLRLRGLVGVGLADDLQICLFGLGILAGLVEPFRLTQVCGRICKGRPDR